MARATDSTAGHDYMMHFPPGGLPPNDAFWSLTMGDAKNRFVANPINRYSVSDRSGLVPNADGSVDIYSQNTAPVGHESNWLPGAGRAGPVACTVLFCPRPSRGVDFDLAFLVCFGQGVDCGHFLRRMQVAAHPPRHDDLSK